MVNIRSNRPKLKAPSQEERLTLWEKHFQDLLSKPSQMSEEEICPNFKEALTIKKGIFTIDKIQKAVKSILNMKACELDRIPAEVLKVDEFHHVLLATAFTIKTL